MSPNARRVGASSMDDRFRPPGRRSPNVSARRGPPVDRHLSAGCSACSASCPAGRRTLAAVADLSFSMTARTRWSSSSARRAPSALGRRPNVTRRFLVHFTDQSVVVNMPSTVCPACGALKHPLKACYECRFTHRGSSASVTASGADPYVAVPAFPPPPRSEPPQPVRVTTKRRARRVSTESVSTAMD